MFLDNAKVIDAAKNNGTVVTLYENVLYSGRKIYYITIGNVVFEYFNRRQAEKDFERFNDEKKYYIKIGYIK